MVKFVSYLTKSTRVVGQRQANDVLVNVRTTAIYGLVKIIRNDYKTFMSHQGQHMGGPESREKP
jgi:hypothetical protein